MGSATLTDDAFLGGRLEILQPARGYRAGIDAVLAAAAAPVEAGCRARVMDAGAGVGVIGLAIASRIADAELTLVEIDPALAGLAHRNAERNGLGGRVYVVVADIAAGGAALHAPDRPAELGPGSFDHIVSNPPFYAEGTGTPPSNPARRAAHQLAAGSLDRWLAFLATAAGHDATLTMIHRADRLADVLAAIGSRFGRVQILPVYPTEGMPANRIVIRAVKGSRAPLVLLPGLVLQEPDGRFRAEVEAVLRQGAPLDF